MPRHGGAVPGAPTSRKRVPSLVTPRGHPERVLATSETGRPPRRHDTFAVLERARAGLAKADVVLDAAREHVEHARLSRTRPPQRDIDAATVAKLREVLGRPDEG